MYHFLTYLNFLIYFIFLKGKEEKLQGKNLKEKKAQYLELVLSRKLMSQFSFELVEYSIKSVF